VAVKARIVTAGELAIFLELLEHFSASGAGAACVGLPPEAECEVTNQALLQ
jgi:hypothetical protein